jgi:hypothetical protein
MQCRVHVYYFSCWHYHLRFLFLLITFWQWWFLVWSLCSWHFLSTKGFALLFMYSGHGMVINSEYKYPFIYSWHSDRIISVWPGTETFVWLGWDDKNIRCRLDFLVVSSYGLAGMTYVSRSWYLIFFQGPNFDDLCACLSQYKWVCFPFFFTWSFPNLLLQGYGPLCIWVI